VSLLVLGSIAFLLAGPRALDLVESKASSHNLTPEMPFQAEVLAETTSQTPVVEIASKNMPEPELSAKAVVAFDTETGKILYQKNMDAPLAPASTTKIMTAIVAIEAFNNSDLLTVPPSALVGGSNMGLQVGEIMTFRSLLYGMMLNSGNDAAFTIAMNYPGGFDAFVFKMNEKAKELGLKNTHFDNPAGFDSPSHYSSAFDLLQIGRESIKNVRLGKVFSTKETQVTSIDKTQTHVLKNLNKLLGEAGIVGIKTGTTEMAGESLVGLSERGGHTVLTVMLNSKDRFGETKTLLDWIYSNYSWTVN
jgi:serine-type D-Ala-D-Ala carboxypeptidase (penicillin-binding protein 5/6)